MKTLLLSGHLRRRAQSGEIPLRQIEERFSLDYSSDRIRAEDGYQISVATSDQDWKLVSIIRENSLKLGEVTDRARGDEMSGDGLIWRCPGCAGYTVPGKKKKGGGYKEKDCPHCHLNLAENLVSSEYLVADMAGGSFKTPFIDGKVLNHRYIKPQKRYLRTDLTPVTPALKDSSVFRGPKILIRQAGVGVTATIIDDDSRCPQSIYIYRVNDKGQNAGLNLEMVLASLVSRIFFYVVTKTFGEVDPARAFNKLTHERLFELPIVNPSHLSKAEKKKITHYVRKMIGGEKLGGQVDFAIEQLLAKGWGLTPSHLAYINSTFSLIPEGQSVSDLFPDGPPQLQPFPADEETL